jgi:hypothetical protein
MREILFRGKPKNLKGYKWVHGQLMHHSEKISKIYSDEIDYPVGVTPDTVGQFTGLYDSTKWEDLTNAEKLDFYHQHYIGKDGMSVRFQHIDDVKFLWKGKKIFEGDIVRYEEHSCDSVTLCVDPVKFVNGQYRPRPYVHYCEDEYYTVEYRNFEVIGNIHDNPELLEVSE